MYRTERLIIRLNREEERIIRAMADDELLPPSTMARRLLIKEAERRNMLPRADRQERPEEVQRATTA